MEVEACDNGVTDCVKIDETEKKGIAKIKAQYLLCTLPKTDQPSTTTVSNDQKNGDGGHKTENGEPKSKKAKLRGQNKKRPRDERVANEFRLCTSILNDVHCNFGSNCRFSHDIRKFWTSKPEDLGSKCPIYEEFGKCKSALSCRFAKSHVDDATLMNLVDEMKFTTNGQVSTESNYLTFDLRKKLMKKTGYDYSRSDVYLKRSNQKAAEEHNHKKVEDSEPNVGCVVAENKDEPKKSLKDWAGKLYLAPLTTVGNLPFRRICVEYGAEITCGEMAMATELLQGHKSEWALVRRHSSEKHFGVQLCGGHADTMTKCAQLLVENTDVDFIDVNIACPIELVCQKGAGCMLMDRHKRLEDILGGMNSVMGQIPLTLKMRTGISGDKHLAHLLAPNLNKWGVSAFEIHGRSKEQRYTKTPDWSYINQVAAAADPVPCFGCGDVLNYDEYYNRLSDNPAVSGILVARGALIKPWIFTEIKERRHWDISSSERLDILRKYVNNGLEHWGSDQQGVDTTRRFLLEWLSFLHRYVPVGLLERVPRKINERPQPYFGRDDLETMMASNNCGDWVKISEMLLGPVSDSFQFLPKHKANSYQ